MTTERSDSLYEPVPDESKKYTYPRKPPKKRKSFTYKIKIGGTDIFLTTGEYPNGDLAEIFIDVNKQGSTMRSLLNCIAILTSLGIQYGVPLKVFTNFFSYMHFEPNGLVDGYPRIRNGTSIVDVIFRLIGIEYLSIEKYADDVPGSGDTINKSIL